MDALKASRTTPLTQARRVVLKIGSALLVDAASGALRVDWLSGLARDVVMLRALGADVVIVSSGSIALGRQVLGFGNGSLSLDQSQAAAAVGQIRLARAYEQALQPHGIITAQVLVTLEDSDNRRRYLNTRATLETLLSQHVVPIVNENDTVATDEIRFGDNDRLAAQITGLCGADVLVLLSDVDGLYTANPKTDAGARHIPHVHDLTPDIEDMAGGAGSSGAKGGMKTKLMAAKTALQAGAAMAITFGDVDAPVSALMKGARATWFEGSKDPATARKLWIGAMRPRGRLIVDEGAAAALRLGRSLLPAGVREVEGPFGRGDAVSIITIKGDMVAKALAGYDADELEKIAGQQSTAIEALLGHPGRPYVVHRDDMVI